MSIEEQAAKLQKLAEEKGFTNVSDPSTALDMQTLDDGSIYLARIAGAHRFMLSVTDQCRPETEAREVAEVLLDRKDLLTIVSHAARLLAEDEAGL